MSKYILTDESKRINKLGRDYVESISSNQFDSSNLFLLKSRTPFQISLANSIVEGTQGLIHEVCNRMLNGEGWSIGRGNKLSLKGFDLLSEELTPYGSIAVLENLHLYRPDDSSVTTFVGIRSAVAMYNAAGRYTHIPLHRGTFGKARSLFRSGRKIDADVLADSSFNNKLSFPQINALAIAANYVDAVYSDEPVFDNGDKTTWGTLYLKYCGIMPDEYAERRDLIEKVRAAVSKVPLTDRDKDILEGRFLNIDFEDKATLQELGDKYGITRERVRQVEDGIKKKLRKPLKRIFEGNF